MTFQLSPEARADGHRLHVHDTLGSTNAQALALSRAGETGPLWIVAHRQNAGRGRRGSAWISPEGNLAATLLMPVRDVPAERVATLGFVGGLALGRALDDVADAPSSDLPPHPDARGRMAASRDEKVGGENRIFALKWPNDVLADGAKIAGILLEAEGRGGVAVGFGINVASAPEGLPYPATALRTLGIGTDASRLFETLTARFAQTVRIWNKGRGFTQVRRLWLERAAGLHRPVSVRLAGGAVHGRFEEIDEGGRLIILAPDGQRHTVTAGEVHFGEAATAA